MLKAVEAGSTAPAGIELTKRGERYCHDASARLADASPGRAALEAAIEEAIDLLDALDGDVDIEDGYDLEADDADLGLADSGALDLYRQEAAVLRFGGRST